MNRLPVFILVAIITTMTVVTGCSRAPRYDGCLVAADSLMRSNPDSALALVEGVCRDSLAAEGDRAYRDLLLTQARYRCYVTATSDSVINRALAYYCAHQGEREKLTRAYLYKGAIMEDLGHPDSAMLYYKHAESNAAPNDYFNLGYSNLRIAQLYQSSYVNDSAVVARMKKATGYFKLLYDTTYLITTIGTQGSYPRIVGEDSAIMFLERAILMAKMKNSPKVFQYKSKLAGINFYGGNYNLAKDLAMDIVRNGKNKCNEKQFYYYAARAYIHLNFVDSAQWLLSQIPSPKTAIDSMNHYCLLAEISQATRQFDNYVRYNEAAKSIDTRLLEESRNSKLTETELIWTARENERKIKTEADDNLTLVICLSFFALLLLSAISFWFIKKRLGNYRNQLARSRQDLERMLEEINEKQSFLEAESERLRCQLNEKNLQLAEMNQKRIELEREQASVNRQVSSIVRNRHAALNELYQSMRIASVTDDGRKRVLPLMSIIKEMFEKRGALNKPPQKSFWDNIKLSVDGEYQGIASFVEQKYPNLSEKDMHLFLLVCARFPNQIIKLCMNYAHDATVSKNKKKLMTDKIGMNVKLEEFIQLYLQNKV